MEGENGEEEDLPGTSGRSPFPTEILHELKAHTGTVCAVRFNKQGVYCMSCGRDRNIILWNPRKGLKIKSYEGHGYVGKPSFLKFTFLIPPPQRKILIPSYFIV